MSQTVHRTLWILKEIMSLIQRLACNGAFVAVKLVIEAINTSSTAQNQLEQN